MHGSKGLHAEERWEIESLSGGLLLVSACLEETVSLFSISPHQNPDLNISWDIFKCLLPLSDNHEVIMFDKKHSKVMRADAATLAAFLKHMTALDSPLWNSCYRNQINPSLFNFFSYNWTLSLKMWTFRIRVMLWSCPNCLDGNSVLPCLDSHFRGQCQF